MKAIEALELGKDCGLDTVWSALENINVHATNLFPHNEITHEITELIIDFNRLWDLRGYPEMSIEDAIELMEAK